MPIIAVANQKGGVGKTTSTLNLGAALQEAGKRVLLVDLDPQGNLSIAAGIVDIDAVQLNIGDLLALAARGRAFSGPSIQDAIIASPSGLDIVPANPTLSAAELGMVSALNRESMLATVLRTVESEYDYILIDCLPSLGLLAINALRAAHGIVIPVQADFLAMQGLAQIFETIAAVREQLNPDLQIYGVLLTLVDQRTAHSRDVVRVVRSSLAGQVNVFDTEVRLHVALKETAKAGRSILDYDTNSRSAQAYRSLATEVVAACGDQLSEVLAVRADELSEVLAVRADEPTEVLALRGDEPADHLSVEPSEPSEAHEENLLDLPILVAPAPEVEPELVRVRPARADAPAFETFILEGWQRWLGTS